MKLLLSLLLISTFSFSSLAEVPTHMFSAKQSSWMKQMNLETKAKEQPVYQQEEGTALPYGEYENQGYLIFNDEMAFNSYEAKRGFLENLPDSITPVIFTQNQSPEYIQSLRERFGKFLKNSKRLKIMYLSDSGNSFWARDNIPVPMYYKSDNKDHFLVVDANYYYNFEPDQEVASRFGALMWSHEYFFEGGNFVANAVGDCLVVENPRVEEIPDSIFKAQYGCKQLVRLPYLRGIGHADESVKFINANTVLTDLPAYEKILTNKGFTVVMIPKAERRFETYLNSVILEDTVYMPAYGNELDEQAMAVYRSLGYNPIPLNSYSLSNRGQGSLHCISMVYPKVEFESLLKNTGGEEVL